MERLLSGMELWRDFVLFTIILIAWGCLLRSSNGKPRLLIVGGTATEIEEAKKGYFVVSIRSRNPMKYFGDNHFCGGTIISEDVVLTAAHCVVDRRRIVMRPRRLLVVAGTINRLEVAKSTRQIPVTRVEVHPSFLRGGTTDIAILFLKTSIPDDERNIKKITYNSNPPPFGEKVKVYGWGRIFNVGPYTARLRMTHVVLKNETECKQIMPKMKDGCICSLDEIGEDKNPCRGDAGGPVIHNNMLIGVISWTLGCGVDEKPSLYVDIERNYDWITKTINGASKLCFTLKQFAFIFFTLLSHYILQI